MLFLIRIKQQPLDALALHHMAFENFIEILSRPIGIPDPFRINHQGRPQFAAIKTLRRVNPYILYTICLHPRLQVSAQFARAVRFATAAHVTIGALVDTAKNMASVEKPSCTHDF